MIHKGIPHNWLPIQKGVKICTLCEKVKRKFHRKFRPFGHGGGHGKPYPGTNQTFKVIPRSKRNPLLCNKQGVLHENKKEEYYAERFKANTAKQN